MSSKQRDGPFTASDPHCGVCEHIYFRGDWNRPPYCTKQKQTTSITVGDVCSAFSLRKDLEDDSLELDVDVEIDWDDETSGTEAPFYTGYEGDEKYGYLCGNCNSFDIAMDTMGQISCNRCENKHSPTNWDAAYM